MGKGKKKHSKKDEVAEDILDVAAISVKKFGKVTRQIAKLSTGQKIAGGLMLVAAGLVYLAKNDLGFDALTRGGASAGKSESDDASGSKGGPNKPQLALAAATNDVANGPAQKPRAPRKSRKDKHEI